MHARDSRRPAVLGVALAVAFALLTNAAASAQDPKPKRKDTNPRLQPPEVTYEVKVEPAVAKPGDTVTYSVTVKVDDPWHIYAYAKEQPDQGPRNTQFDFFDPAGLKAVGDWEPDAEPEKRKDPAFNNQMVEYHEGQVVWSREFRVPADAKPGKKTLQNQIYFQICNESSCKPPTYATLPAATLTIEGGGETIPARPDPPGIEKPERESADREPTRTSQKGAAATRLSSFPGLLIPSLIGFQAEAPAPVGSAPPAAASPEAASQAPATVQEAIQGGLFSFLVFSALGGVAALLMPCVWPMVPITVNFFVKQGHARKGGSTTGLAVVYCVSIIAVFTLVGVLCSALMGATALNRISTNPWLNLAVTVIFLAFGLSLLGLFEIRLPSFLLNASAQNEARGGYVGVIFMALTLTITSFTCTFPVVGGLLVIASKGQYFYPILGMMVFSGVLALPFFLMAIMPGQLAKLPRSGDWMNSVKVVGGLVEIGAALKFLNQAEVGFGATPKTAWVDTQVILASWVILAAVCGIYLLGLFRTDHDQEAVKVGPGRIVVGSLFLILALYLAPALFGNPPRGRVYDQLVVGLLPLDVDELDPLEVVDRKIGNLADRIDNLSLPASPSGGSVKALAEAVHATSSDPQQAIREEKTVHGVVWGMSLDAAKEQAKAENKPVLIDFTGVYCPNCRLMEQTVFPEPKVIERLRQFETVQLYVDSLPIDSVSPDDRVSLAEENNLFEQDLVQQSTQPYYVVLDPSSGEVLAQGGANLDPSAFASFLDSGLAKFKGRAEKVASTGGGE
jgi:thiol:disulfide interchange protein DsbD